MYGALRLIKRRKVQFAKRAFVDIVRLSMGELPLYFGIGLANTQKNTAVTDRVECLWAYGPRSDFIPINSSSLVSDAAFFARRNLRRNQSRGMKTESFAP